MYKFEDDRIIALKQLKKNALSTFNSLLRLRIPKITKEIETLRGEYKSATDKKEKDRIAYEGRKLKDEIEMYKSI